MITVYCLIDPRDSSIFYVGRTSNFKKRMLKHNSPQTNVGTFKNEYIKELKAAGYKFIPEILEEVETKKEGRFWEEFYTDLFRSWGYDLQNNRYYKMGNQTSFQPGHDTTAVVCLTKQGEFYAEYPSVKQANATHKTQVGQALMTKGKINRTAGGYLWRYKSDYEKMTPEQLADFVKWANSTNRGKPNSGQFKKGLTPWNKRLKNAA